MSSIKIIYTAICYSLCYSICYNLSTVSASSHTDEDKAQEARADENNMLVSELIGLGIDLLTTENNDLTATASKTNNLRVEMVSTKDADREKVSESVNEEENNNNFKPLVTHIALKDAMSMYLEKTSDGETPELAKELEKFLKSDTMNHIGYYDTTIPKLATEDPKNKVIRLERIYSVISDASHEFEIELKKENAGKFILCIVALKNTITKFMSSSTNKVELLNKIEKLAASIYDIINHMQPKIVSARCDRDINDNSFIIDLNFFFNYVVIDYLYSVGSHYTREDLCDMMDPITTKIEEINFKTFKTIDS